MPLAALTRWACHRPTRAQNTRQEPPRCCCQASVPRRAAFAVPTLECEWWVTVASTAATVCCSCRHHERRRRCLRRHAAPDARSAISLPLGFDLKGHHKRMGTLESYAWLFCVVVCCCVVVRHRIHTSSFSTHRIVLFFLLFSSPPLAPLFVGLLARFEISLFFSSSMFPEIAAKKIIHAWPCILSAFTTPSAFPSYPTDSSLCPTARPLLPQR